MADASLLRPVAPARRKRGSSLSESMPGILSAFEDAKKFKFDQDLRSDASPDIPSLPVSASALGTISETFFDELCLNAGSTNITYRHDITNLIYDTLHIEDLPPSNHLRAVLQSLNPLPAVALRANCLFSSYSIQTIPSLTLKCPADVILECTASLTSLLLPVIPCSVHLHVIQSDEEHIWYRTELNSSALDSDLAESVLTFKFTSKPRHSASCGSYFAAVVLDLHITDGPEVAALYKIARRSRPVSVQLDTLSSSNPRFLRMRLDRQKTRVKPNLSLSIPSPGGELTGLMKVALATNAFTQTPGPSGLVTPINQRIPTPSLPPPLKTDIDPTVLGRFAGTPTEPYTPSLPHRQSAAYSLTQFTQHAMAAGTPILARSRSGSFALASPMSTQPLPPLKMTTPDSATPNFSFPAPAISIPNKIRRSHSISTPVEKPSTPGGYFRLGLSSYVPLPPALKRSQSTTFCAPPSTPGGYFKC